VPISERSESSDQPIPLPVLLKSLVNPALGSSAFTVKEAIPLAGKLVRAKLNTQVRLSHLNGPVLEEDAGIASEQDRNKILIAFGVRQVGQTGNQASGNGTSATLKRSLEGTATKTGADNARSPQANKRKRWALDDDSLSREYGNVQTPRREPGLGGEQLEYVFNEVLDEDALRGRYAHVNRAPIMTAWTTLVLERLGFQRREALSLAHCYVNTTSTARGISLGIIPRSERDRAVHIVGSNQPHFELMGVKIPLMKLSGTDEWRGISAGQVVGPDQAFNYMRKSMYQTLPLVIGALTLLADSYVLGNEESNGNASLDVPSPDLLHERAYELYTQFRPETAGEWGKKSSFYCSKALALRRGHEAEIDAWDVKQDGEALEAQEFERELKALYDAQQTAPENRFQTAEDEKEGEAEESKVKEERDV
jgi:hypothetical protein